MSKSEIVKPILFGDKNFTSYCKMMLQPGSDWINTLIPNKMSGKQPKKNKGASGSFLAPNERPVAESGNIISRFYGHTEWKIVKLS